MYTLASLPHHPRSAEIENSPVFSKPEIIRPNKFKEKVFDVARGNIEKGFLFGLGNFDNFFRPSRGKVITVTGISRCGKSDFVDQLVTNYGIRYGGRTIFYSPENYPAELHIQKLSERLIGKPFPLRRSFNCASEAEIDIAADWVDEHCYYVYPELAGGDSIGANSPTLDRILDDMKDIILADSGVNICVMDPWNKVEHTIPSGMREDLYIAHCLRKITAFARAYNVLFIIVAHPTKMDRVKVVDRATGKEKDSDQYRVPTPYDISGGAHWLNASDFILCVHRNPLSTDVEVHIQKVKFKHLGQLGKVDFGYDYWTGRYRCKATQPGFNLPGPLSPEDYAPIEFCPEGMEEATTIASVSTQAPKSVPAASPVQAEFPLNTGKRVTTTRRLNQLEEKNHRLEMIVNCLTQKDQRQAVEERNRMINENRDANGTSFDEYEFDCLAGGGEPVSYDEWTQGRR